MVIRKKIHSPSGIVAPMVLTLADKTAGAGEERKHKAALAVVDRRVLFDFSLSTPSGTSCASYHQPQADFADHRAHLDLLDRSTVNPVAEVAGAILSNDFLFNLTDPPSAPRFFPA